MEQLLISHSVEETQDIAVKLVNSLETGAVICLYGDLAAGKTTFSQGLAKALGVNRLTSPTFIIMREYPVTIHPVISKLYHLDLYRLNSVEEIKAFDVDEIWTDPTNLLIIEWPEKFRQILPDKRIDIYIRSVSETERELRVISTL